MFQPEIGNECTGEKMHVSLMHNWKMKEWKSAKSMDKFSNTCVLC
jgi:hypothetical protein